MANLFTIFGEIAIRNDEANKAISDTTQKAGSASKELKKSFEKIGNAAVKCGKAVAAGLAVGAAAVGTLMKASIGEYADYEQLVGGVETLFKESQGKVMEYANSAYKTAGLSANEYMETVTSFSASLLQGLDGDTEKAAEIANLAITDMADNANKMGTDMSSIQNAYQGFAKQNYTMLDNLKLGYGGTQTEMARLINDSGVLGAAITVTADTVNQVPFHKIVEAIHIIQDEMEITGTTAKEASDTISGSFSSFKATWKNLLVGLASGDQDVNQLFANFTSAGKTAAKNVISVIPSFIRNLQTVLTSAAQFISTEWANTIWPKIQETFQVKFGVELPDWTTVVSNIREWWNSDETAYEKLKDIFKWTLGTFIAPETDSFYGDVKLWWENTGQPSITKITQWTFGQLVLPAWMDLVESVTEWWNNTIVPSLSALTEWVINPKFPSWEDIKSNAVEWWDGVKTFWGNLSSIYSDFDPTRTYTPEYFEQQEQEEGYKWVWDYETDQPKKIPVEGEVSPILDENAEEKLQSEVDAISLEAVVKLIADDSGLALNDSSGGSTQFGGTGHSFAKGLDYVPYDGFPAILHKREAVLTATQADAWRSGSMGGADVSRLETAINSLSAMMQQVVANTGRGQTIVLDSGALVGQLAPQMDTRLGTIANRKGRRNG